MELLLALHPLSIDKIENFALAVVSIVYQRGDPERTPDQNDSACDLIRFFACVRSALAKGKPYPSIVKTNQSPLAEVLRANNSRAASETWSARDYRDKDLASGGVGKHNQEAEMECSLVHESVKRPRRRILLRLRLEAWKLFHVALLSLTPGPSPFSVER
jgi:hypothetical protein